jgi:P-loop containing NTP hydrolase pore-1
MMQYINSQIIMRWSEISVGSSCSACLLPPADYPLWDSIGDDIVNRGLLSQLQLEGVMYASMKHLQWLPSGQREFHGLFHRLLALQLGFVATQRGCV